MIQKKDYLMLMIERLGIVLARLIKMRSGNNKKEDVDPILDEALEMLNHTRQSIVMVDPKAVADDMKEERMISLYADILDEYLKYGEDEYFRRLHTALKDKLGENKTFIFKL